MWSRAEEEPPHLSVGTPRLRTLMRMVALRKKDAVADLLFVFSCQKDIATI